jgi:hypothetical protein
VVVRRSEVAVPDELPRAAERPALRQVVELVVPLRVAERVWPRQAAARLAAAGQVGRLEPHAGYRPSYPASARQMIDRTPAPRLRRSLMLRCEDQGDP